MGSTKVNHEGKKKEKETYIGTYISVGVVGLVILATYLLLYGLYMSRI